MVFDASAKLSDANMIWRGPLPLPSRLHQVGPRHASFHARYPESRKRNVVACARRTKRGAVAAAKGSQRVLEHPEFVSIKDMDTDGWKVASKVPQWLERGAVGIIPTDSQPALCCRLHDGEAVERLYRIKGMGAKKPLSIMCRDLRDVGLYTNGFPQGQVDWFRVVKKAVPGPYTFIMQASKALPKQITDFERGTTKHRRTVGVRIPADPLCRELLGAVDGPLLVSTAPTLSEEGEEGVAVEDEERVSFVDLYDALVPRGLDFVVSRGHAEEGRVGTTVVDMTSRDARVVRAGAGDPEPFGGVPEVDLSDEAIQSELKVRPVPNRMPKAMADVVMWD